MTTLKSAIVAGSAFALFASLNPAFAQLVIADFEAASGYTVGANVSGQDNWVGAQDGRARVTPDPAPGSYTFVINGGQSAFNTGTGFGNGTNGNPIKLFNTEGATAAHIYELSWLQAHPDAVGSAAGGGIYLINAAGSTPAGMLARNTVNGPRVVLSGNSEVISNVPYEVGGGGAPTLNDIYRFTLQFDFVNSQVTGFSENISDAGSRLTVGTVAISNTLTAANVASDYGVWLHSEGGYMAIDDITLNPVPEPTSLALLGGALGLLLARSRRSRARQA